MLPEAPLTSVAHAIQLAVAPVFLLTGVGAILGVLSNRLGRIIDRGRVLTEKLDLVEQTLRPAMQEEITLLSRRARLISFAIGLCTTCALLVCTLIAVLFAGSFVAINMRAPISLLFVAAMLALILALVNFLREVYLATANLRVSSH